MTIAETLQGDGRWSLQLRDDTPGSVVERLYDRYSLLKVTATQVPSGVLGDLVPLYTGIRLGSEQWGEVHGAGPLWLLGTPLSDGQTVEDPGWRGPFRDVAKTSTTGTITGWVSSILPANGVTLGALGTTNGNPALAGRLSGCARGMIDAVAAWFGCEYQVSSDLEFFIATRSGLFGDTDEYKVLLVREDSAGHDAAVAAWTMTDAQLSVSDEDRVNRVYAVGDSGHNTGDPSDGFHDPSGSQIDISYLEGRYTTESGGVDGDDQATAAMSAAYAAKSAEVRSFTVSIEEFEPVSQFDDGTAHHRHWFPGGNVGIYDPAHNVFDTANPVAYRGRTVFPALIRVVGWEWPIRSGYGVYLDNSHNDGGVVTDLTPYVAWEDQDITLTVGQLPPSLSGARRLVAP